MGIFSKEMYSKWEFFVGIPMDTRCTRTHRCIHISMCVQRALYATKSDILLINKSTEGNIHSLKWWANRMGKHRQRREGTDGKNLREDLACNGYMKHAYILKLWQWTLFYAYNHIFSIFFSIFSLFFPSFYIYCCSQRVYTHTHTADTDTHKQTACESTFYIVDRWSVCTRINITFVRSCAGMQTHIHTLCVLKVWWNCKYPVFFLLTSKRAQCFAHR